MTAISAGHCGCNVSGNAHFDGAMLTLISTLMGAIPNAKRRKM